MTDATNLILIGGGGHALVVADAAELAGLRVEGFLDDATEAPLAHGQPSCPRLGSFADLERFSRHTCILAIGNLALRRKLIARMGRADARTVIHPRAIVSPSADIGRGVYVGPGAVVHTRAVIANHAIINSGCIVEHECRIGENAHIAPGTVVGGRTTIGADTLVGIGSRILPGQTVGKSCIIGAGAAVISVIEDGARVAGVPAKPL